MKLPFTVKEIPSQDYPVMNNFEIEGFEEYEGGSIASIITSNQYYKSINSRSELVTSQFDLNLDEEIFIEVVKKDGDFYHFLKLPSSENIRNIDDYTLLTEADDYCSNLPIYGLSSISNYINSSSEWEIISVSNGSIEKENQVTIKCIARLTNTGPLEIGGIQSDRERTFTPSTNSIVNDFLNTYEFELSDLRNFGSILIKRTMIIRLKKLQALSLEIVITINKQFIMKNFLNKHGTMIGTLL